MNRIAPMFPRVTFALFLVLWLTACSETQDTEGTIELPEGNVSDENGGGLDTPSAESSRPQPGDPTNPGGDKDSETPSDTGEDPLTEDIAQDANTENVDPVDAVTDSASTQDTEEGDVLSSPDDIATTEDTSSGEDANQGAGDALEADDGTPGETDSADGWEIAEDAAGDGTGTEPDSEFADTTEETDAGENETIVFSEPVSVSEQYGFGQAYIYSLAVTLDGRVGVLWAGAEEVPFGQAPPPTKLLFSISDVGVTSFEAPLVITESIAGGVDNEGDILIAADNYLLTWQGKEDDKTSVVFRKSGTLDMEGEDVVVTTAGVNEILYRPYFIKKNDSEFCIAYQRTSGNSAKVQLSCSSNGGESFEDPRTVTPPNLEGYISSGVYVGESILVVAYHGHEFGNTDATKVYLQTSDDDGETFSNPIVMSGSAPAGEHFSPSLAIGPGSMYGAWHRKGDGGADAWFISSDNTTDWSLPANIPALEEEVKLRSGPGNVLYATSKIEDINPILAIAGFVRSGDGGNTWGELYPIDTVGDAYILDHDIISNRTKSLLHMVWSQFDADSVLTQALYVMTITDQQAQ